jgi:hypothetical protein
MINKLLFTALLGVCLSSYSVLAQTENSSNKHVVGVVLQTMDDALVFADFSDELPAVINYFTAHSEQEILDFYQGLYGEPNSSEIKRGRLTLHFSFQQHAYRVVISQQNKKRQVDVLVQ